jgi:hypothetical protein
MEVGTAVLHADWLTNNDNTALWEVPTMAYRTKPLLWQLMIMHILNKTTQILKNSYYCVTKLLFVGLISILFSPTFLHGTLNVAVKSSISLLLLFEPHMRDSLSHQIYCDMMAGSWNIGISRSVHW